MNQPNARRPRVLIVEDDERLVLAIQDALSDVGYETKIATGGRAAIQSLASGALPDVIVLDLMMPLGSGFEVVNWLHQKRLAIPVVLSTQEDDIEAADVGAVVKLSKPYTLEKLLDCVATALRTADDATSEPPK